MSTKDLLITNKEAVRKAWDKTPENVQEYIDIIKEWMKSQKHLPEIPDDNFIEFILTNCKYSVEKTKANIDIYYTIRSTLPELFNKHPVKSDVEDSMAQYGYYVVLPKLTKDLFRISLIKYTGGGDVYEPLKLIAHGSNMYEVRMHEDLVMGEIFMIDMEGFSMTHCLKLTPTVFKNFVTLVEKVWSNRVKEMHVINYPPFIDKVMSLAKLFFKKKLYDRIFLHADNECLYKNIPQEMLPVDYGGTEKSLQELADLWRLKFKEYEKRFDDLETMKVDESLRPEPLENSEILGYYGNFKKLDVD